MSSITARKYVIVELEKNSNRKGARQMETRSLTRKKVLKNTQYRKVTPKMLKYIIQQETLE